MIPRELNTYELIEKCKFVATPTGTAAFEAITGGKHSLSYGRPWFRGLPGISMYKSGMHYKEITGTPIDHDELEKAYNKMMDKSIIGLRDPRFSYQFPDYDREQNIKDITFSIEQIFATGYAKEGLNWDILSTENESKS